MIIPISLLVILGLLFMAFNSFRHALLVLTILPFAAIGGVLSLLVTHTPFSISAAVGFASVVGVCTLGGVVFVSGIRRKEAVSQSMLGAIERGGLAEMRPVMMACAAAGLGAAARGGVVWHRRAGAAAARARGGGRNDDGAVCDFVPDSRAGKLLALFERIRR